MKPRYDQSKARAERAIRAQKRAHRELDAQKYPTLATFAKPLDPPVRDIIGRDAERDQILASLCRPELSNVLLLAPPGSGKALDDETLVAVDDLRGYARMADLVVGDRVFDASGRPVAVSGVFPQGDKAAFAVSTGYGGDDVVCNDEHLWTVLDARTNRVVTKTLGELMELGMTLLNGSPRFSVPAAGSVNRSPARSKNLRVKQAMPPAERLIEDVLITNSMLRSTVIDRLTDRYRLAPYDREHVCVQTHNEVEAVRLVRLLSCSGYAARQCATDPVKVCWRLSTPQWYPITVRELSESRPMTCIKVASDDGLFQAGTGHMVTHNTALTQSVMLADPAREYIEVDPAKLITDLANPNEMGSRLKRLFDEAEQHAADEDRELVLFIDEFHQIVQLSEAAVEALKPVLADSGARGLRFIGATTYDEYNTYIKKNAPLDERLQRISLTPTDDAGTVRILRGMAERYDVGDYFADDNVFNQIVEITNRYQPSSVQPRKAIRQLDSMIGLHRYTGEPMDMGMLTRVVSQSSGVNLAFNVDGASIKKQLDAKVYSQQMATQVVNRRLQLCVADLHDKSKPLASFLFAGSTGVGKTELTKQLAKLMFGDDRDRLIRFDMSEFADDASVDLFRQELTRQVSNQGHAVILLDEIEKASRWILRLLLQVLDDGRMSDENGRQVNFLNTYIVMTTNAGSEVFNNIAAYEASDTGDGTALEEYLVLIERAIKNQDFPPELLSRIDEIVPFQPLSRATQRMVLMNKLRELRDEVMLKHNVNLSIDPKVLQYLTDDLVVTAADAGGARGATRVMQKEIATEIARFINENPEKKKIVVYMKGDLRSDNKNMRKTRARPAVAVVE